MFSFMFGGMLKLLIPIMEKKVVSCYTDPIELIFDLTRKFRIVLGVSAVIFMVLMKFYSFFIPFFFITSLYVGWFSLFLFQSKSYPNVDEFFCFYNSFDRKHHKELYLLHYLNERFGDTFIEEYYKKNRGQNVGELSEYYVKEYEKFLSLLRMKGIDLSGGSLQYLNFERQLREVNRVREDMDSKEADILKKMTKSERGKVLIKKEKEINEFFKIENT